MVNKNKKGQEFSVVTLVILGLAILTALIIAWGFYTNWTFITGKTNVLPFQELQTLATSCIAAAKLENKIDYCKPDGFYEVKESKGKLYVNCEYSLIQSSISEKATVLTCDSDLDKKFCAKLREDSKFKGAKVNEIDCTALTVEELKTIEDNEKIINDATKSESEKTFAKGIIDNIYYKGFIDLIPKANP